MTDRRSQTGFSLIEALAAIAIMAIIVAIAVPNMARSLDSISFNAKSKRYLRTIESLRISAFFDQRHIIFPQEEELTEPIPVIDEGMEGWTLSGEPLVFLKTGVCLGGEITLHAPSGRSATYVFAEPDCVAVRQ